MIPVCFSDIGCVDILFYHHVTDWWFCDYNSVQVCRAWPTGVDIYESVNHRGSPRSWGPKTASPWAHLSARLYLADSNVLRLRTATFVHKYLKTYLTVPTQSDQQSCIRRHVLKMIRYLGECHLDDLSLARVMYVWCTFCAYLSVKSEFRVRGSSISRCACVSVCFLANNSGQRWHLRLQRTAVTGNPEISPSNQ